MAQEFTIKSEAIESKINQLLPTQGGFQPGVDFSASTMVIPIVDLTETAEGSALRQDLQSSFSFSNATAFNVTGASSTIINTTGYYRIFGTFFLYTGSVSLGKISLTDGLSTKDIFSIGNNSSGYTNQESGSYDFIVKLEAGDSCVVSSSGAIEMSGASRQISDINGNLTNP